MIQVESHKQWLTRPEALRSLKQIFLENSVYLSRTLGEQQAAFEKWLRPYRANCPDWLWGAFSGGKLVAYLSACPNSENFLPAMKDFKSYPLFQEYFSEYPCHFHINTSRTFQGKGVGTLLVETLFAKLKEEKISGCHIVTSPGEKNIAFYEKQGFTFQKEKDFADHKLLFMARSMS